jgi:hypothetical protein
MIFMSPYLCQYMGVHIYAFAECTLNGIDVSREMTDISWILIINIFAVLYLAVLYGAVYIIDRGLSALFAKFRDINDSGI